MDTVVLDECQKCRLRWVNQGEQVCPRCRTTSSLPNGPVIISGYEVEVKALVLHGDEMGLRDSAVRKGLDVLNLFERCSHGFISYRICPKCYKQYA